MGTDNAWLFWLNHVEMVEKVSARFALDAALDVDDFKQELLLRLVRRHHAYDQTKCRPVTWAWWQARAVRSAIRTRDLLLFDPATIEPRAATDNGAGKRRLEAAVGISWVRSRATSLEWNSICVRASGATENELETIFDCSPVTVRRRIKRLANRLEKSHAK